MTYVLELKHVLHQSYQEEIFLRRELPKMGLYSIIRSVWSRKINPPLPLLAGLDNPERGQVLFDGKHPDQKEICLPPLQASCFLGLFQIYNLIDYLTPLEGLSVWSTNKLGRNSLGVGLDVQIKRNVLQLSGGQQQRWPLSACARSRKHLSSWQMSRQGNT